MMVTNLVSVGGRTIFSLRATIPPLVHGRAAMSWQKGCLNHLSPGNTTMCEFSDTHLRKSRSFLFTSTLRPDSELDISERFAEVRNRMPPPREDYLYTYAGDPYRTGPSYISRRDSAHPRQSNLYRPGYLDEGRWSSSYPLDDTSNSWGTQRSPSSTSRPPRGRLDYRDNMSYEKSLSGSPRSSRFSSPRHSRATASRRAPSPSSSSIRSSRERSKSPPRSREHSRSSVQSSADSRSYTAEPPVRPQVQRSHPVGQFRGRHHDGQRSGMRIPADGFRDSMALPFVPPLTYPNELRPDDRLAGHPSLPLRPSPPYLTPGPGGRNRLSERGFSGPMQSRYPDSQASRGEILA